MRAWYLTAAVVLAFPCASPVSAVPLRGLVSIDLTADGQYAVIACRKDRSIAIVDLAGGIPYASTNLTAADGIGLRPIRVRCVGSTAVIVNEHDTTLTLVDVPSAAVVGQVAVPMYSQDVVWDEPRGLFYVSNRWLDRVFVFDAAWVPVAPLDGMPVGRRPGPMTLAPDGRLFVGNRGSFDVSVVDPDTGLEDARVDLGSRPEDLAATATSVLVTNHGGAGLPTVNGIPIIENDQVDIRNVVTEIDAASLTCVERFEDLGADYLGIDVRAGLIVFAGGASGTVHIHDTSWMPGELASLDLLAVLPGGTVGGLPQGNRIFTNTRDVVARFADQVFAINFLRDTLVEVRFVKGGFHVFNETPLNAAGVPIMAFQPAPAVNMTPVQHGERYFNTLSAWSRGQEDFSCQTCHSDGHTDFRLLLDTKPDPFNPDSMQGPERHPSARFTAFSSPFAWEGDKADLEAINVAALDAHDTPPANGKVAIDTAQFMVLFEESLVGIPNPSPPGSATGESLFEGLAGCASCHPGPLFTDNGFHDVGTGRVINTPSLLGVWDQTHLLHDGRAETLEEVLDPATYGVGGVPHGNIAALTDPEKDELAAYVRGLTGPGQFPCGPDLNCDGVVDIVDLLELLAAWGNCPLISNCIEDLDGSGDVGIGDLLILLAAWG